MRPYEAIVIHDSSVDDSAIDANLARITDLVTAQKGSISQVEKWGRRRFAYEIKHKWEGTYAVVEMDSEPAVVAEIDRFLTLADDVIRHKIVRLPDSFAGGKRPAKTTTTTPVVETESRK